MWAGYAVPAYLENENKNIVSWAALQGDDWENLEVGTSGDPVAEFGILSARIMIDSLKRVPKHLRAETLKTWLAMIDPELVVRVDQIAKRTEMQGRTPLDALESGLRVAMANGLIHSAVEAGKGNLAPLGALGCDCGGPQAMAGPWSWTKSKVQSAAGAVADVAGSGASAVANAVEKVGDLACAALSSGTGQAVIGAAATSAGGPVAGSAGVKGAKFVASKCGGGGGSSEAPQPKGNVVINRHMLATLNQKQGGGMSLPVKVAIAGAGVGALYFLLKK